MCKFRAGGVAGSTAPLLGVLLALAAVIPTTADARPAARSHAPVQSLFDGSWSLVIQTVSGACESGYRLGVEIVNGIVAHDGTAYGRVAPRGTVQVRVANGSLSGEGQGRLSRRSGQGVWRGAGSSGACAGVWSAQRRSD